MSRQQAPQSRSRSREASSRGVAGAEAEKGSESLWLVLPVPPSTNNAYSNNPKTRGRHLTPKGRQYKADALHIANAAGARRKNIQPPYRVSIIFYFPDERKRDVANFEKLLVDALSEALGVDDSQVHDLHLMRRVDRANPRAEVTVKSHDIVREEGAQRIQRELEDRKMRELTR